ncbi:hypothetical protein [Paraburkholderia fynbosensis]|nr:hypothetical protein [Paraburkholderia fynbosensis]
MLVFEPTAPLQPAPCPVSTALRPAAKFATLDRGASAHLAMSRALRAARMPRGDIYGHHDAAPHAPSMPRAV